MRAIRRFLDRLHEPDEVRLAEEIREWADSIPGSVRIASAPTRERVRIAGVIRRMTVIPMKDNEALEAHVSDGTGEVLVRFMGRRSIVGLGLGSRIVVEGMLAEQRGVVQMLNPQLELTA
jgi:RecG-like helicase